MIFTITQTALMVRSRSRLHQDAPRVLFGMGAPAKCREIRYRPALIKASSAEEVYRALSQEPVPPNDVGQSVWHPERLPWLRAPEARRAGLALVAAFPEVVSLFPMRPSAFPAVPDPELAWIALPEYWVAQTFWEEGNWRSIPPTANLDHASWVILIGTKDALYHSIAPARMTVREWPQRAVATTGTIIPHPSLYQERVERLNLTEAAEAISQRTGILPFYAGLTDMKLIRSNAMHNRPPICPRSFIRVHEIVSHKGHIQTVIGESSVGPLVERWHPACVQQGEDYFPMKQEELAWRAAILRTIRERTIVSAP